MNISEAISEIRSRFVNKIDWDDDDDDLFVELQHLRSLDQDAFDEQVLPYLESKARPVMWRKSAGLSYAGLSVSRLDKTPNPDMKILYAAGHPYPGIHPTYPNLHWALEDNERALPWQQLLESKAKSLTLHNTRSIPDIDLSGTQLEFLNFSVWAEDPTLVRRIAEGRVKLPKTLHTLLLPSHFRLSPEESETDAQAFDKAINQHFGLRLKGEQHKGGCMVYHRYWDYEAKDYISGPRGGAARAHLILKDMPKLDLPNLRIYGGMLELLDPKISTKLKYWNPRGGYFEQNKEGSRFPAKVIQAYIKRTVSEMFPSLRGVMVHGTTMKQKSTVKHGKIYMIEDHTIDSWSAYKDTL